MNTITTLVFHINYYITIVSRVLEGGPLQGNDKDSFITPLFTTAVEWQNYLDETWNDANRFAGMIEALPEERIWENFAGEKYGNHFRNLFGIIEHTHYHLGQIVLIKKLIRNKQGGLSRH